MKKLAWYFSALAPDDYGLYSYENPLDALEFTNSPIVYRLELIGKILSNKNEFYSEHRKVLWTADAKKTLHLFACWSVDRIFNKEHKWKHKIDKRIWDAAQAKHDWIEGKITDRELSKYRFDARAVVDSLSYDNYNPTRGDRYYWGAIESTAQSVYWSTIKDPCLSVRKTAGHARSGLADIYVSSRYGFDSAAGASVCRGTNFQEKESQNNRLTEMLMELHANT